MTLTYASLCSGVEAASLAWEPLGWKPAWFSEIDKFPSAVLAERWPHVPNRGDMTKFKEWPNDSTIDVLVGGTPCQSFSVAGLRKGLDDPRGNLMLTYLAIADRYRPKWLVWENVPGVLSSNGGRDFAVFLGALGKLGYGWAYRVLDAQYFGVPQRRRRVFVVGCLGGWQRAAAVLFERHSLQGHPAPGRGKGEVAPTTPARSTGGGGLGTDFDCDGGLIPRVAGTLKACAGKSGTPNGAEEADRLIPVVFDPAQVTSVANHSNPKPGAPCHTLHRHEPPLLVGQVNMQGSKGNAVADEGDKAFTLNAMHGHDMHAVCIRMREGKEGGGKGPLVSEDQSLTLATANDQVLCTHDVVGSLCAESGPNTHGSRGVSGTQTMLQGYIQPTTPMQVRRLTPVECERLQGFPDNYTRIPWRGKGPEDCPDGPRYKAMGNSMAVPVMAWIGRRIQQVSELIQEAAA